MAPEALRPRTWPDSPRPHFAWWRRLVPTPESTQLPAVRHGASPHLKWARKVHTQQKAWLQQHCQLCKPLKPLPKVKGAVDVDFAVPLYGTVLRWATQLRQESPAKGSQEQRLFLQRRGEALQKLQQAQRKWRRQYQHKRRRDKERRAAEELASSMQSEALQPVGLTTLEEEPGSSEESPSSSGSMSSSDSAERRLPTLVLQKALLRRNSLQQRNDNETASAKDVISSDVNLAELFDAGEEETEEEKKTKQLASLNGDYMASRLMSRTEERPLEVGVEEPPDVNVPKEQFIGNVRSRSEEWRREFPVEVLNQLAAAYDSWKDEDGLRTTSLRSLNHVLRYLLGWPPTVLQHVLEEPPPERLCFQNLRDFLELVKHALEVAEVEGPEVLWSEWDLNLVRESFRKHSSTSGTMPVVNLFKAIEGLGFEELRMKTFDKQRWLARITKQILARKDGRSSPVETSRRESWAPPPRAGHGAQLTFRDFLRVASKALRDAEKREREKEFREECEAIQASEYSMLQVEDLRELHMSFSAMKVSIVGSKTNFDAMQDLLERVSQKPMDPMEASKLRSLLAPVDTRGREKKEGTEAVSFKTFLCWMKELRQLGIEGFSSIYRPTELTMEEVDKRRGFHIAILREQLGIFLEQ